MEVVDMRTLFMNFEDNCGWKSITKFLRYCEEFESKKNFAKVSRLYKEFSETQCIKKDYTNFRRFCLVG